MKNRLSCQDVEALIFDRYRDELSDLKRAAVDDHLQSCTRCSELTTKMGDVFDLASGSDGEQWGSIDSEGLFERIEANITDGSSAHAPEQDLRLDEVFEVAQSAERGMWVDFDSEVLFEQASQKMEGAHRAETAGNRAVAHKDRRRRWIRPVGLAALAAACLALITWWVVAPERTSTITSEPIEIAETEPVEGDEGEPGEDSGASHQVSDRRVDKRDSSVLRARDLPALRPTESTSEALNIFASDDADLRFVGDDDQSTLELDRGSVLVEYLRQPRSEFSIRTGSHRIDVVGTVFSVSMEDDGLQVAVFEGVVRVAPPDGEVRHVEAGEFFVDGQTGVLPDEMTTQVALYIDLERHRQLIRGDEPDSVEEEFEEPAADDSPELASRAEPTSARDAVDTGAQDSPRALREAALQAQHRGENRRAVTLLTRALDMTGPDDQATADILLELAGIHLRKLDEPRRAADYLSRFLARFPDDPAADAVRSRLCTMTDVADIDDELCH